MSHAQALTLATVATLLAGSATAATRVTERDLSSLLVHCEKPVASISLGAFSCKAAACEAAGVGGPPSGAAALLQLAQAAQGLSVQQYPALGAAMGNGLTTALKETGCFVVQEREALEELRREAALSGIELKPTAADFLISGAITSVAVNTKSTSIGGGMIPVIGAVSRSTRSATLGIDVRLIDVKAANVRASRAFSADSTRSNWGAGGLGYGGGGALFGATRSTSSPELDSVANEATINAANFVAETLAGEAITRRPAPLPSP